MCQFCCGATGPVYGMFCNDRVRHEGNHHTFVRAVDENGEHTDSYDLILEWPQTEEDRSWQN